MRAMATMAVAAGAAATGSEVAVGSTADEGRDGWGRFLAALRAEVGAPAYENWFGRLELDMVANGVARVSVPTAFLRSWLNARYLGVMERCAVATMADVGSVFVATRTTTRPRAAPEAGEPGRAPAREAARAASAVEVAAAPDATRRAAASLVERFSAARAGDARFDMAGLLEGESNAVALAAARRVIAGPGPDERGGDPLVVRGDPGTGKTHLLQAIARGVCEGGRRGVYMSAQRFMYEFAVLLRDEGSAAFRATLAAMDVLLVDDLQFVHGKDAVRALADAVATMVDSGRQVVVACDRDVRSLGVIEERTRARLAAGFPAELGRPDEALRLAMLRRRVEEAGRAAGGAAAPIGEDVLAEVAAALVVSHREVGGAANRLVALADATRDPRALAASVIADVTRGGAARRPRIEEIQRLVAAHYGTRREEMWGVRRTRDVVRPRQVAMYLSKALTERSLPEIGRRFGGRDHTTVLHAVVKIQAMRVADEGFDAELELFARMLGEGA